MMPRSGRISDKLRRQKKRKERIERGLGELKERDEEDVEVEEGEEEIEEEIEEDLGEQDNEGDFDGKRYFSTARVQRKTRPMTFKELAHRSLKFNELIRDTINEYLGVFSQEKFESQVSF